MSLRNILLTLAVGSILCSWSHVNGQVASTPSWTFPTNWPTAWPTGLPSLPTALPPPPKDAVVDAGELGKIQGAYSLTSKPRYENGRDHFYWVSVPYAKPESYTGDNRFKIRHVGESEIEPSKLLPVIFFIHGGGFNAFWGSIFGGHRLLNRDVVLINLNYRLGILGSLNLGLDNAPGNGMLYDCITALDWVQKYIHFFGGDPSRVTVSGQSAGAVLSTSVFLSPLAKGKFHGAIGASGSAHSIWANNLSPMDDHLRIASFTSCKSIIESAESPEAIDLPALRECIRHLEIGELIEAADNYSRNEKLAGRMGYDALVPSIQSEDLNIERCLIDSPATVLKKQEQSNVPLMMGVNRHDGSFVFDTTYYNFLVPNNFVDDLTFIKNDLMPIFLKGVGFEDPTGALYHSLQRTYLGDAVNTNDFESKIPGLLDIHTVLGFKAGAYDLVEGHAKLNKNSYYYAFDYKGMFSTYLLATRLNGTIPGGVAHVDDLIYLFQLFPLISEKDEAVARRYVDYWVNFATYGNPNGPEGAEPFPPFSAENHQFLIINDTDKAGMHCRNSWVDNSLELMKPKV